jgi:hypothetical protein
MMMMDDECGAIVGMLGRGNRSTRENLLQCRSTYTRRKSTVGNKGLLCLWVGVTVNRGELELIMTCRYIVLCEVRFMQSETRKCVVLVTNSDVNGFRKTCVFLLFVTGV